MNLACQEIGEDYEALLAADYKNLESKQGNIVIVFSWRKPLQISSFPWLNNYKVSQFSYNDIKSVRRWVLELSSPLRALWQSMAVEAIYQSNEAPSHLEGKKPIESPQYRLRTVTFDKALVLKEGEDHEIMLTLAPVPGGRNNWHEFVFSSLNDSV